MPYLVSSASKLVLEISSTWREDDGDGNDDSNGDHGGEEICGYDDYDGDHSDGKSNTVVLTKDHTKILSLLRSSTAKF